MFNTGFLGLRVDSKRNVVVELPLAAPGGARDASALKDAGSRHFAAGAFAAAAAAYTAALDGSGAATGGALRQALLSNRAAAPLRVGDAAGALADCDAALAVDCDHPRRAQSRRHRQHQVDPIAQSRTVERSRLFSDDDLRFRCT